MSVPRTLCIEVHDVAPSTWPACAKLLAMLDALGAAPLTLLVVPDHHHRSRVDTDAAFVQAIGRRIARGDEIVLHGFFHVDDSPPPRSLRAWLRRRMLTAGEGEFESLDEAESALRIEHGLELFERLGWRTDGFVAPAWLLGDGARRALTSSRLRYTATHRHIEMIGDGTRIAAPCLTVSARSPWRRALSRIWLRGAAAALAQRAHVRVALHPIDSDHAMTMASWQRLLREWRATRDALTTTDLVDRVSHLLQDFDGVLA